MLHLRNVLVIESLKPFGVKLCHLLLQLNFQLTSVLHVNKTHACLITKSANLQEHLKQNV